MLYWPRNRFFAVAIATLITATIFLLPPASRAQDAYSIPQTGQVTLAWDANDPAPDGYRIYQRTDGQAYDYSQPVWTGSATSGTVYNLAGDTTYYYVVRAYAGSLQSADSEEVSYTTAAVDPVSHTISASAGANGGISPSGAVTVSDGAGQTFSIAANTGYHIDRVTVDGVSKGAIGSYTFADVTADHTISATFAVDAPSTCTITAAAGSGGSISPSGGLNVERGTDQTFMITPDTGYHIVDVTVDGIAKGPLASYTFPAVSTNHTISASFAANSYPIPQTGQVTLAWDANDPAPDGYRIYQRTDGQTYDYSQPVWSGAATSGTVYNLAWDTTYYFVVRAYAGSLQSADSEEVSYTTGTTTVPISHTITAAAGGNGDITPAGSLTVTDGGQQSFTITPDSGYRIADVSVDGRSKGAISAYTFSNVTGDHTIAASFAAATHTITASAGANGMISPAGSVSVAFGDDRTFVIAPDAGYHVADVTVDGVAKGALASYTFPAVSADHTISATFAADTYRITATAGTHGMISPAGVTSLDHGASQPYLITPDAGYHVADVRVDGVSVGAVGGYTFSQVDRSHTISAAFSANTISITASCGDNGSITPAGTTTVSYGDSLSYSIAAESGYTISDVQVDGQSVGAVASYQFFDVTGAHTISATFAAAREVVIELEAEEGDLFYPMEIGDDGSASAGGFVWAGEDAGDTVVATLSQEGCAEYRFSVPENGDYVIWGRELSTDSASDSFFVSVDGQEDIVWHTKIGENGDWTWDVVSVRNYSDPRDPSNPKHFYLTAGEHTLRISLREDGTKIDKLLITNQVDLTEIDEGGDDSPATMEFGDVDVNHQWKRVAFEKTFTDPVVVAGPLSNNGGQPALVRIRNVDPTGFEIRIQEWEYLDGYHADETVGYLVVEQGSYTLADGTRIEAANLDDFTAPSFREIAFTQPFNTIPVVMSTVTSVNDPAAVVDRMRTIHTGGFSCRLQEQEANTQDHGTERLSYIAWEPSAGTLDGTAFVVGRAGDEVKSRFTTVTFAAGVPSAPVMVADMQSTDGGDTANVRYRNLSGQSVDVKIAEEQSKNSETAHTDEVIGYMLFNR